MALTLTLARPRSRLQRWRTVALVVILCLLWGLTYTAVKAALRDASPLALAVAARGVGVPASLVLALWLGGTFPLGLRVHVFAFVLGVLNVAGLAAFINLGAVHVSSGEASLIVYTQPLLTALAARFWLGERGGPRRAAGLLIGFAGLTVVLSDHIHPGAHPYWLAYIELFGAAVSWTAGTLIFKRVPAGTNLIWLTTLQNVYGALPLLVLMPLIETARIDTTLHLALLLIFLGAVTGPIGWLIWLYLLERGEASVVSGNMYFVPLVAVLAGVLLLGEHLQPVVVAGAALIAIGIALVNRTGGSGHSAVGSRAREEATVGSPLGRTGEREG